jgi:hypothetical protein
MREVTFQPHRARTSIQSALSNPIRALLLVIPFAVAPWCESALALETGTAAVADAGAGTAATKARSNCLRIVGGDAVALPECPVDASFYLEDDFERAAAATLGPQWSDCNSLRPDDFEPLGIHDGGVVIADAFSRPGEYDSTPPSAHPPLQGRLHPGIGCAFRDTGSTRVTVKITWSGHHGVTGEPPISHVEGTPLLYVAPEVPRFGFGAWTTELFGRAVIFAGYIGAPPEDFEVIASAVLEGDHVSGEPREVELRAEEPGRVTVWVDGKQVNFGNAFGLNPIEVDSALAGSTLHGFAVDSHLVEPVELITQIKSIEDITITSID